MAVYENNPQLVRRQQDFRNLVFAVAVVCMGTVSIVASLYHEFFAAYSTQFSVGYFASIATMVAATLLHLGTPHRIETSEHSIRLTSRFRVFEIRYADIVYIRISRVNSELKQIRLIGRCNQQLAKLSLQTRLHQFKDADKLYEELVGIVGPEQVMTA